MIRVAFPLIGGLNWLGGYNYLLNLLRVLDQHASDRVQAILFVGTDVPADDLKPFVGISATRVVRHAAFDQKYRSWRLLQALAFGRDSAVVSLCAQERIDVIFEPAQYYGWRMPIPALAWIPDFQHRRLRQLFGFMAYWKRELGFRAQVLSGREFMLSSEDARRDCEAYFQSTRQRTHVVRFASFLRAQVDESSARAVADRYGLPRVFFLLPNQFWSHKNHECVIRALALLKERGSSVTVAASGVQSDPRAPQHFPRLLRLIQDHGLQEDFRLIGCLPSADLTALMRSCAALINPSRFEGWSSSVEEAKSQGTPMILSNIDVHREQAAKQAAFFDPSSPVELANILATWSPYSREERASAAAVAAADLELRTLQYADEFSALAELVARRQ